jgi:phage terminase small subunit
MPKPSREYKGFLLTDKQIRFCQEYCRNGWNGTQAAIKAGYSVDTAKQIATENLSKPVIREYIDKIKNDFELLCGISKAKIIEEHQKLAFSSISHLHNTWIERKEFDQLTDEQKACIAEISTQVRKQVIDEVMYEIEFVKIKLYDKQKALDSIAKLMGYEATIKTQEVQSELSEQETRLRIQKLEKELGIT